ncbi:MAG TPA: hypothetical protein VE861_00470 [Gemmatimonadaceae bacterium]|nr:hypothetical protein [Gemmatimonadaceae bacterium]
MIRLLGFPFTWGGASGAPPVPVINVATPLTCVVKLFPSTSEPVEATGGGGIPTLIARTATDHVLQLTTIREEITGAVVEPTDIRYVVADGTGTLVTSTITAPISVGLDEWQIALSRALFTPTRGPMTLTLTLVAPDTTETQLVYTLAQGVAQ